MKGQGFCGVLAPNLVFHNARKVLQVGWPKADFKSNIVPLVMASYFNSENLELGKVVHSKLAKIFAQQHNGV